MIAADFRFEGFDAKAFARILSLFSANRPEDEQRAGMLVVVQSSSGVPCAAFVIGVGPVDVSDWDAAAGPQQLDALCARHGVRRAVLIEEGAIEELTEGAAAAMPYDESYEHQWLAIVRATRKLEDEGAILWWPRRSHLPIPTPAMLNRALDLVLPPNRTFVVAIWKDDALWTGFALERASSELCRVVGPDFLLDWAGPLAGDFRRDHRAITRAVSAAMSPVHLGVYAQREPLRALLRSAEPGAWARAVALRDMIIMPAAPYVHVALGADALRAAGKRTAEVFGGLDLASYVGPFASLASLARDRVSRVASLTQILGFNPLEALASRMRHRHEDPHDDHPAEHD